MFFLSVQNICNGPPIFLSACLIADHLSCCRFRCFGMHRTNGFLNALIHHPDVPSILKSLTIRAKCGSVIVDAHFSFFTACFPQGLKGTWGWTVLVFLKSSSLGFNEWCNDADASVKPVLAVSLLLS